MKWLPAAAMMLVSTISYIDRNTLALLAPTILRETHLSNEQYGFIISAFSFAYMLGNPIWGALLDRIGVRRGMLSAVSLWTAASAAHAFAAGFRSFAALRAVLGFGEGATFPGALRTVVQTLPVENRSRGIAISYSGGSLGALITPVIVTPIAAAFGWTGAFWFTGAVGLTWLAMWVALSRRRDLQHLPATPAKAASPSFRDARLWAFLAAYSLGGFPAAFILYESSIYLNAVMRFTQVELGYVLWIPPLGWELGYFFWGWIMDRYASAGQDVGAMRRLFLLFGVLSVPPAFIAMAGSSAVALALMFLAMFIAAGFIIGAVAYATARYSMTHSSFLAGLGAGSWSALVAMIMPGIGRLFDLHRYGVAFELAAMVPVAGCILWMALARRSAMIAQ